MSLVNKDHTFSAGATILASEHNENFDTIYSLVNGNLSNANISSSANIADTKLAQIASANKVALSALTATGNYTPTGIWDFSGATLAGATPLVFEGATADDFETSIAITDPTADRTITIPDADVDLTAINSIDIEDYGTSGTTGTAKTLGNLIIAYGVRSVSGSSTATVTGLNFTSSSSYVVTTAFGSTADASESIIVTRDSASQITLRNTDNQAQTIHWIAIGT